MAIGGLPDLSFVDPYESTRRMDRQMREMVTNIKGPWEQQAELYINGLKTQVEEREAALKPDEVLSMICTQGNENFAVQSISMPSHNVVALHCLDSEGNNVQLTGHMHAITFSFRVKKAQAAVERKRIGFEFPSAR